MSQVIDTKLWYDSDRGVELLRARFSGFCYDVHTHDTACLALITAGAIRIRMRGAEFVAREGDIYAIDLDEPHAGWPIDRDGWSQRTIYADLAVLRGLVSDGYSTGMPVLRGPIIRDSELASCFSTFHRQSELGGSRLTRDECYLALAHRLFAHHVFGRSVDPKATHETAAIAKARDFLDSRLDSNVSLAEIAAAAGLSPHRIYRAFEREMGMTPHVYQRQARIRLALDLIRRGEPLADIAVLTGFADQPHLTRSFRARMGITPGAYRQARSRTS